MVYVSLLVYVLDLDGRLHQRHVLSTSPITCLSPIFIYRFLLLYCRLLSQLSNDLTIPLFTNIHRSHTPFFLCSLLFSFRTTLDPYVIDELIVEHDVRNDIISILVYNSHSVAE